MPEREIKGLLIDLDALGIVIQVRRGVQSHLVTRGSQHAGAHCRDRALALGACHVQDGVLGFGVAKQPHQFLHAVQLEIRLGKFAGFFQAIIHEGIQVIECLVVDCFGVHTQSIVNRFS